MMSEEIKWEAGQEVWDVIFGKGVVVTVEEEIYPDFPVTVRFEIAGQEESYTKEGKLFRDCKRSLFFSEPVVAADLSPPKKKFKPILEPGELVVIMDKTTEQVDLARVIEENEFSVRCLHHGCIHVANKKMFGFYGVGEEIEF